jgi:hypothetical protein
VEGEDTLIARRSDYQYTLFRVVQVVTAKGSLTSSVDEHGFNWIRIADLCLKDESRYEI